MHVKTGKEARIPLHFGPMCSAQPVIKRTMAVAVSILIGISHEGAATLEALETGRPAFFSAAERKSSTRRVNTPRLNEKKDKLQAEKH
jgi:hypothetical protein